MATANKCFDPVPVPLFCSPLPARLVPVCSNPEQDSRWGDAEKKLLRRTKFSKVLEQKVNMKKVNMDVMQRWIAQRITSLLGFEDDIVVGTCVNYLSEEVNVSAFVSWCELGRPHVSNKLLLLHTPYAIVTRGRRASHHQKVSLLAVQSESAERSCLDRHATRITTLCCNTRGCCTLRQ